MKIDERYALDDIIISSRKSFSSEKEHLYYLIEKKIHHVFQEDKLKQNNFQFYKDAIHYVKERIGYQ